MEQFLGEVTQVRNLSLSVVEITVRLVAPNAVTFAAGQHMVLHINGKSIIAPIAAPPHKYNLDLVFLLDLSQDPELKSWLANFKISNQITMDGPSGDFIIVDSRRDILGMAAGVGIAPFAAMVPTLLESGYTNKLKLLFEVKAEEDVFYFDRFRSLASKYPNFSFVPLVVRPHANWPGEVGLVVTYIEVSAEYLANFEPYICGSDAFVTVCSAQWKKSVPTGVKPLICNLG